MITFFDLVVNITKIEKDHTDHTMIIRINCTVVNPKTIFSVKQERPTTLL